MTEIRECELCGETGHEEDAHEAVVIREGASLRTADEIAAVFVDDVISLCGFEEITGAGFVPARGWAKDAHEIVHNPDRYRDALDDVVREAEDKVGEAGYIVSWDDGYVIYRYAV